MAGDNKQIDPFSRSDPKFNQVVHGHSTPSLKISCRSVQRFSRNVVDKERKKERNRPKTIPRPPIGGGVIMFSCECIQKTTKNTEKRMQLMFNEND